MVHGANKSSSRKRVDVKTSTKTKRIFVEKKASKAESITGKPLAGTPTGTAVQMRNLAKTQKRPNRPFGGVMNSPELRTYLRSQARLSLE